VVQNILKCDLCVSIVEEIWTTVYDVRYDIRYACVCVCIHCFVVGDAEGISSTGIWDSMSVRHAFIRKVLKLFVQNLNYRFIRIYKCHKQWLHVEKLICVYFFFIYFFFTRFTLF